MRTLRWTNSSGAPLARPNGSDTGWSEMDEGEDVDAMGGTTSLGVALDVDARLGDAVWDDVADDSGLDVEAEGADDGCALDAVRSARRRPCWLLSTPPALSSCRGPEGGLALEERETVGRC